MAAIAGLGSFGLHHMLITDAGCAGRFGSLVVDAALEPTSSPDDPIRERCLYFLDGSCRICVERCPVGALTAVPLELRATFGCPAILAFPNRTESGLDKHRCYEWLLQVADQFPEVGFADACGKCATGPCAW